MLDYIRLGKKIYNTENPREARRMVVFVGRCLLNMRRMKRLYQFFTSDALLGKLAEEYPFVYEQPTRAFFYNKSTLMSVPNLSSSIWTTCRSISKQMYS